MDLNVLHLSRQRRRTTSLMSDSSVSRHCHRRLRCYRHRLLVLLLLFCFCRYVEGLSFVVQPSSGVAALGGSFWFHCEAEDGANNVTYLWRFGDADVNTDGEAALSNRVVYPNGSLLIREVKEENVGQYTCVATAASNNVYSEAAQLQLAYIGVTFETNPQNTTAELGQSVTLQCDIDSLPVPQFTWRVNGLDLDLNRTTVNSSQGQLGSTLVLSSVRYSDAGEYVCVATNSLLDLARFSLPGRLTVVGPPVIETKAQDQSVPITYNVVFDCVVTSNPPANLTWFFSTPDTTSLPLQSSDRVEILPNKTLMIRNATTADSATYRCVAANSYGEASLSVLLIVSGQPVAPSFVRVPENQTLNAGDLLRLNCSASGNPTPRLTWTKGTSEAIATGLSLHIESVTAEDAGNYSCVATNTEGTASVSATVTVLYAPVFVTRPQNVTAQVGETIQLPCDVKGEPPPVLQWITPKSVILPVSSELGNFSVSTNGTLTVTSVASEDQGRYTCFASNVRGSATAVVLLTVEGPPHFTSRPSSHVALEGERTTFSCHAAGYPTPEVTWYRASQEQPLQQTARVLLSPYGDLTIVTVVVEDDGAYRCVARNSLGSVEAFAVLTVHAPPTFAAPLSSQSVILGQTVVLMCMVTGIPVPSQRWVRGGETLTLEENMSLDQNHTLTIRSIRHWQLGQYTCMARNQAGERATTASLHLSGQPYFTAQPFNTTVNVSDALTLSCRATQSTQDQTLTPSVHWYRGLRDKGVHVLIDTIDKADNGGDNDDGGGEERPRRYWATKEGDLVFEKVLDEDESWYYCNAVNREAMVFAQPIYIRVQVPPMIRTISNPPATPDQGQVNLTCFADGDPAPVTMWRSPEGRQVNASDEGYGLVEGVLTIEQATNEKDGGMWVCVACNLLGCDSADTFLGVEGKPVIRKVEAGQNSTIIHISCIAVGLPPPVVTFTAEGSSVNQSHDHHVAGGHLYIGREALKKAYTCTAGNSHGEDSLPLTAPQAPELLGATPASRSVTLSLNTVGRLGGLPLEGVLVEYRESDTSEWTSKYITTKLTPTDAETDADFFRELASTQGDNSDEGGNLEVRVTGLVPYSMYLLRVKQVNVLGEGPVSSTSVRVFTLPGAPPPPNDVTLTSENKAINVTWVIPAHLNGNKDNIDFKVQVTNSSGVMVAERSVAASQPPKVIVSDLELGNHSISLTTVNSQLQLSSVTVTRLVLVVQAVPVFVPSIVNVSAINDTAVTVTWKAKQEGENPSLSEPPVEGYAVRAQSVALAPALEIRVTGVDIASHVITGLHERTRYSVSVAAYNSGGTGAFSASVAVMTYYALFSNLAYESEIDLALSGLWIAALGGCIGGVVLIFIVVCLFRKWKTFQHGSRLDLLQSSHGLDPFYMENPKGLYDAARSGTVRWLRGIGAYRLFGNTTTTTTTTNNNNSNDHIISSSSNNGNQSNSNKNNNNDGSSNRHNNDGAHSNNNGDDDDESNINSDNRNGISSTVDNIITATTRDNNCGSNKNNDNNTAITCTTISNGNNNNSSSNTINNNNNKSDNNGSDKTNTNTNTTTNNNRNNSNTIATTTSNNNSNTTTITTTTNNSNTTTTNSNSNTGDGDLSRGRNGTVATTVVAMETDQGCTERQMEEEGDGGGDGDDGDGQGQVKNRRWWHRFRLSLTPLVRLPNRRRLRQPRLTISHPHFSGHGATVVQASAAELVAAASSSPFSSSAAFACPHYQHSSPPSRLFSHHLSLDDVDNIYDFPDGVSLSSKSESLTTLSVDLIEDNVQREMCTESGDPGEDVRQENQVTVVSESERKKRRRSVNWDHEVVPSNTAADCIYSDLETEGHTAQHVEQNLTATHKDKSVTVTDGASLSHTLSKKDWKVSNDDQILTKTDKDLPHSFLGLHRTLESDDKIISTESCSGYRPLSVEPHYTMVMDDKAGKGTHKMPAPHSQCTHPGISSIEDKDESVSEDGIACHPDRGYDKHLEALSGSGDVADDNVHHIPHHLDKELDMLSDRDTFRDDLHGRLADSNTSLSAIGITLVDGASVLHIPPRHEQGQKTFPNDGSNSMTSPHDLPFQNDVGDGAKAGHTFKKPHSNTSIIPNDDDKNVDGRAETATDDKSVTVTDGESVYHILHRLDQDLEDYMATDTLETSVDVDSLNSSSAELPHCDAFHADLDRGIKMSSPSSAQLPPANRWADLDPGINNSVQPQELHSTGPLHVNDSQFQSESHKSYSSADVPGQSHQAPFYLRQDQRELPAIPQRELMDSRKGLPEPRQRSPFSQHGREMLSRQLTPDIKRLGNKTDPEASTSASYRSDVSNASSPVFPRFNAELDSYEINPLYASSSDLSEPTDLYAKDHTSNTTSPLSDHRHLSPLNPKETTSVRMISFHQPTKVDRQERKVLEELFNTFDSLGPLEDSPSESSVGASRPKFYSAQRRKRSPLKKEKSFPKFFTLQRNRSSSPWMKSDKTNARMDNSKEMGSIRSHGLKKVSSPQRRFSVEMALPTGLTKLSRPGNHRRVTTEGTNAPASPWQHRNSPTPRKPGTWKEKSPSSKNSIRKPRWSFLFENKDYGSSRSSSFTSSVSGKVSGRSSGAQGDGKSESGSNSTVSAARAKVNREDAVFGRNSAGAETANLY